jgi:exopolyphosphatase / guanosine-5'-triphosphate,3'-diphosphate pyrophosphatase
LKIAAIDIGSNAVRLLIEEVFETDNVFHIYKVSLTRVPLRLGDDVFDKNRISKEKLSQLTKTLKAFWYLMDAQNIEHFRACATSAMREADNSDQAIKIIKKEANIKIEVISGREEANLIFSNFAVQKLDKTLNYLYIDVGGGSTEVTLIKNGKRIKYKSFPIGTVRMLKDKVSKKKWEEARKWIEELCLKEDHLVGIGTGGNINRLHKECGKKTDEPVSYSELLIMRDYIDSHSFDDRIVKLKLKPDRADVIVPAADIYLRIMEFANVEFLQVPKIGLSDGIILNLYKSIKKGIV